MNIVGFTPVINQGTNIFESDTINYIDYLYIINDSFDFDKTGAWKCVQGTNGTYPYRKDVSIDPKYFVLPLCTAYIFGVYCRLAEDTVLTYGVDIVKDSPILDLKIPMYKQGWHEFDLHFQIHNRQIVQLYQLLHRAYGQRLTALNFYCFLYQYALVGIYYPLECKTFLKPVHYSESMLELRRAPRRLNHQQALQIGDGLYFQPHHRSTLSGRLEGMKDFSQYLCDALSDVDLKLNSGSIYTMHHQDRLSVFRSTYFVKLKVGIIERKYCRYKRRINRKYSVFLWMINRDIFRDEVLAIVLSYLTFGSKKRKEPRYTNDYFSFCLKNGADGSYFPTRVISFGPSSANVRTPKYL